MNNADALRQISQMIEFIKQEAREKAEEIQVKTEAEFNALKLNKVVQARLEIKEEMLRQEKEAVSQKRIARSRVITQARFRQMKEREDVVRALKVRVEEELEKVASHKDYPKLVRALLVEGFITMMEQEVEVRCRQVDANVVKAELPHAISEFVEFVRSECGVTPIINATVNENAFLPGPRKAGVLGASCAGGVIISARHGKILCRNTLNARLDVAFEELLPTTREMLFGRRPDPVVKKPAATSHHH